MKRNVIKKFTATVMASTFFFLAGIGLLPFGRRVLADGYNPGIEAFVNSLYADCLGRNADPTGFNDWCNKLASGQITGKQAAYGFFFSPEFIAKANAWSDDQLIEAYYRVFLNRSSDPAGKAYWSQQIAGTTNDVSILFTGFADSTEFASKCSSYGVTVGSHVDVPTTVRGTSSSSLVSGSGLASQTNGTRASSAEELDAYWTSRGYEIYYIDLGNGQTQKCYALFFDMTEHNNQLVAYRAANGVPCNLITDLSDPRMQYTRMRAVEVAYSCNHGAPLTYALGISYDPRTSDIYNNYGYISMAENIYGGMENDTIDGFRGSPMHNNAMLSHNRPGVSTAACQVAFVQPDGISLYTNAAGLAATPTELPGYSGGLASGTGISTVQCFWA